MAFSVILEKADQLRHVPGPLGCQVRRNLEEPLRRIDVAGPTRSDAFLHDAVDHSVEAQRAPVRRTEQVGHAAAMENLDLLGRDRAATAAVDPNVGHAGFRKPAHEIREELHVAALVGRDGDRVSGFFDGSLDELLDAAVVAEVDDLGALRLQESAHDVDRGVMAVEEGRRGDDANRCMHAVGSSTRRFAHRGFLPFGSTRTLSGRVRSGVRRRAGAVSAAARASMWSR